MILHLLSLGGRSTEEGSSAENQVFSLFVQFLVYQEIFLFRPDGGGNPCDGIISQKMQDLYGLLA